MNALKLAQAVVRFRLLRSLGTFFPDKKPGIYYFDVDALEARPLQNGAPEPARSLRIQELIDDYEYELSLLCELQQREKSSN